VRADVLTLLCGCAQALYEALADPTKPLPTVYGAVVAIRSLGGLCVELLLLPLLPRLTARLDLVLDPPTAAAPTAAVAGGDGAGDGAGATGKGTGGGGKGKKKAKRGDAAALAKETSLARRAAASSGAKNRAEASQCREALARAVGAYLRTLTAGTAAPVANGGAGGAGVGRKRPAADVFEPALGAAAGAAAVAAVTAAVTPPQARPALGSALGSTHGPARRHQRRARAPPAAESTPPPSSSSSGAAAPARCADDARPLVISAEALGEALVPAFAAAARGIALLLI